MLLRLLFISIVASFLSFSHGAFAQDMPSGQETPAASVEDLVRILENEDARNALLTKLKTQVSAAGQEAAVQTEPTLARQIAEQTRAAAEQIVTGGTAIWAGVTAVAAMLSGSSDVDYGVIWNVAIHVVLVGAGLFTSFFLVAMLMHVVQRRLEGRASGRHWSVRAAFMVISTVLDGLSVAIAWGAGYFIALQIIGGATGRMDINQTLLLNAFLMVEMLKVAMRLVLQPRFPAFRLIPMSDTTSAYWYFWLSRGVSLVGYTFMFVAPVIDTNVSPAAAQAVRVLVMLTVTVTGILIVLQNRVRVRATLSSRASRGRSDFISRASAVFAGVWHLVAIAYLIAFFVVWLVNPTAALPFMITATVQSFIAVLVGGLVITFISRFVNAGLRLPDDLRLRLPALEGRLQAFVPRVMQVTRTIVVIAVVIAIAQAWGLIDFLSWVTTERGQRITGSLFAALVILLFGFVAYLAMSSWVEYRLNPDYGSVPTSREKTLLSLFRNAFTIALIVLVTMLALAQLGVNIAPLLAGAGVLGLAVGFGAQKLVQDIITGVFIQLENVMNEGDVVDLGGVSGVVEKLTIRSVSIRSLDGTLHLVPFSSVDTVANMMKGFGYHVAEIRVAYRENIAEVKEAMQEAFELLQQTEWGEKIIGPLDMQGITAFGDSAITVRARIKTIAGGHWGAGRAYNEFIKDVFDRRGIEIPYPHVTLYMGEDKSGNAPPLRIKQQNIESGDEPAAIITS
ncbi:mechanosensitive ion channel domain-containing protein [Limoniibacter endophyticus]|uniref:Mechanosensitive ion channel protein MscS n=1 Tax=Limoniibacter endophyticus TaxID=1565040 RepID=A0A8J3DKT8_9HYPH|nr:mechanosensitive ion channel domain-containing protein [Limoniibacter endophyticus]GHC77550.1 mechanosensitive ion channel protein MscS [Limoniibacter endophyticus]